VFLKTRTRQDLVGSPKGLGDPPCTFGLTASVSNKVRI